jgi:hypothetical protein
MHVNPALALFAILLHLLMQPLLSISSQTCCQPASVLTLPSPLDVTVLA